MGYSDLIRKISEITSVSEEDVRNVLSALPSVIIRTPIGSKIRTPMGMFRVVRKGPKKVKDPKGNWTSSQEKVVAVMRPGKRLHKQFDSFGREIPPPVKLVSSPTIDKKQSGSASSLLGSVATRFSKSHSLNKKK